MSKPKRKRNKEWEPPLWQPLDYAAAKLRAIAHFIEMQRAEDPPLDIDEVNFAVALCLNEISTTMREVFRSLERQDMRKSQR